MKHEPMLELQHVRRCYDAGESRVVALDDVSLTIERRRLRRHRRAVRLRQEHAAPDRRAARPPHRGHGALDGQDLSTLSDAEQTRLRLTTLGFVFQRFHLLQRPDGDRERRAADGGGWRAARRAIRASSALLRAVGLGDRLDFRPSRLSGGQRQRVAIARALANNPRIILADEPTGELHSEDKARVIELFRQFHAEGRAIVMVTHDKEVAAVAERQIEIRDGHMT